MGRVSPIRAADAVGRRAEWSLPERSASGGRGADHRKFSDPFAFEPVDEHVVRFECSPVAWSEIEHDLVDSAALVPVVNPITTFVVSERAGNVQINPLFGVLLGQIWVA